MKLWKEVVINMYNLQRGKLWRWHFMFSGRYWLMKLYDFVRSFYRMILQIINNLDESIEPISCWLNDFVINMYNLQRGKLWRWHFMFSGRYWLMKLYDFVRSFYRMILQIINNLDESIEKIDIFNLFHFMFWFKHSFFIVTHKHE